jgi:hypothetical protein
MILGLVVDGAGRPICTEMWPGNTVDVGTLLPVIDRLRRRFSIGRADRGMIAATQSMRYRDLFQVEDLFRRTEAIMRTRPIFHSSDAAIRGHVFCSFLALSMQKHLDDLTREAGVTPEGRQLLRDLDRLQQVRLAHRGVDWLVRTDVAPNVAALFRAAHIALPPRARQLASAKAAPPSPFAKKRRGRPPGRSATPSQISP